MVVKLINVILALSIKGLAKGIFVLLVNKNTGRCHLYTTIEKRLIQVVELAGIILALSIEVLVNVIFAQPLKAIREDGLARLLRVCNS